MTAARARRTAPRSTSFRFTDVTIPDWCLEKVTAKEISPAELMVLCVVRSYELRGGSCWASSGHVAGAAGVSPGTVRNALCRLTAVGFLTRVYSDGQRFYRTTWGVSGDPKKITKRTKVSSTDYGGVSFTSDTELSSKDKKRTTVECKNAFDKAPPDSSRSDPCPDQHTKPAPVRDSPAPREGKSGSDRVSPPDEQSPPHYERHGAGASDGLPPPAPRGRERRRDASVDNTPAGPVGEKPAPSGPSPSHHRRPDRELNAGSAGSHPPAGPAREKSAVFDLPVPKTPKDKRRLAKGETGPTHVGMARRLREAVMSVGHGHPDWSLRSWTAQLRTACANFGESKVEAVLKWYCEHINEQYTPKAYCGQSFRFKFFRIEDAMERDRKRNPEVVVSPAAAKIAGRLADQAWPKGSESQLPAVVQLSIDAVNTFVDKLKAVSESHPDRGVRKTAAALIDGDWCDPLHTTQQFLTAVWRDVRNWAEWSGNLLGHVWRPDHQHAAGYGLKMAGTWGDGRETWKQLLEACRD